MTSKIKMTRKSYQGSKPEKLYSNTYSCLVPTPHPPWERIKVIMLALTPPLGDYVLCVCSLSLKAGLTTSHHMLKVSSFLWPHPSSPSWQDNFFVMIGNGCGQIQHRYTIFTYLRVGGEGTNRYIRRYRQNTGTWWIFRPFFALKSGIH